MLVSIEELDKEEGYVIIYVILLSFQVIVDLCCKWILPLMNKGWFSTLCMFFVGVVINNFKFGARNNKNDLCTTKQRAVS